MPKSKGSKKKGGQAPAKKAKTTTLFRCYVAFVPKDDNEEMTEFVGDCGEPLAIKWLYHRSGGFRHCGFVDFATQDEANKFVEKNQSSYQDKKIQIKHADSSGKGGGITGKTEIYVSNVPTDDEDAMREFIGDCSKVRKIRWLTDSEGDFRNAGFIDFANPIPADLFKETKNGKLMGSNKIRINYAPNSKPTAFVMGFEKSMTDLAFKKFAGDSFEDIKNINWKNDNTYAFVDFGTVGGMNTFISEKNGEKYKGRNIKVSVAKRAQRKQQ